MEKTKIMVLNENLRASSDACAAQATVTVATAKSVARNKKTIKRWKKGLALAMKDNLWYKHVDIKSGVTSDAHIDERTSWDVLCASTSSPKEMSGLNYDKATNLLHTFLKLLEESNPLFIEEGENWIAVKYNMHVYAKSYI